MISEKRVIGERVKWAVEEKQTRWRKGRRGGPGGVGEAWGVT